MKQAEQYVARISSDKNIKIISVCNEYLLCRSRLGSKRETKIPLHLTPELAYFVGVMLGDGYIVSDRFRIGIEKGNKQYLEEIFLPLISNLFGFETKVVKAKSWWRVFIRNKALWIYLTTVFNLPIGKRRQISVPEVFCDTSAELKAPFIAGILDTDGGKRGKGFGFTTAHPNFNDSIVEMLKQLDVEVIRDSWFNKKYSKQYYGWKITKKSELLKLSKTIPLKNHKRIKVLSNLCGDTQAVKGVGF